MDNSPYKKAADAVLASLAKIEPTVRVAHSTHRSWASITFTGFRVHATIQKAAQWLLLDETRLEHEALPTTEREHQFWWAADQVRALITAKGGELRPCISDSWAERVK